MKRSVFALAVLAVVLPGTSWVVARDAEEPQALLEAVTKRYRDLGTLAGEVEATTQAEMAGEIHRSQIDARFRLSRSGKYLIAWTSPEGRHDGVIWNEGQGARHYNGSTRTWAPLESDARALHAPTGTGQSLDVPARFFAIESVDSGDDAGPLRWVGEDVVDADPCVVIARSLDAFTEEELWISKSSHLVRRRTLSREGRRTVPEMSEAELAVRLQLMGQPATPEQLERMKSVMDLSRRLMRMAGRTSVTETYRYDERMASDFAFVMPADARREDSPLEAMSADKLKAADRGLQELFADTPDQNEKISRTE